MKLTEQDILKVDNMRRSGFGYRRIAQFLGLSKDAVKYYIGKTEGKIKIEATGITLKDICPNCGSQLIQTPHKRRKNIVVISAAFKRGIEHIMNQKRRRKNYDDTKGKTKNSDVEKIWL